MPLELPSSSLSSASSSSSSSSPPSLFPTLSSSPSIFQSGLKLTPIFISLKKSYETDRLNKIMELKNNRYTIMILMYIIIWVSLMSILLYLWKRWKSNPKMDGRSPRGFLSLVLIISEFSLIYMNIILRFSKYNFF
jgi:hypothetical protein